MKFRKTGQAMLAAAVSIGIGLGITSCGESNTIDYLFVTASKENPGQIAVFKVDQESGALTQIPDSPYAFAGRNPVAEVTSPDGADLYVAYKDDNTIVPYAIGTDGKLYPGTTVQPSTSSATEPTAMAISPDGTLLYVTYTYISSTSSDTDPGPGGLVVYPRNTSTGALGTPVANGSLGYWPLQYQPASIAVSPNGSFVYAVNTNSNTNGSSTVSELGSIQAFSVASTGVLTAIENSSTSSAYFSAGTAPTASVVDPRGLYLFVTDPVNNQVISYAIGSSGALTAVQSGPVKTDTYPDWVTTDLSGNYVYVANYTANDISAYQINLKTGELTALSTSSFGTKTGPTCVFVEPAFGRYLYTSNFLDNSITGYKLDPESGILTGTENSPYPTAGQPTCVAAVTHGNHAGEHVQSTSGNGS